MFELSDYEGDGDSGETPAAGRRRGVDLQMWEANDAVWNEFVKVRNLALGRRDTPDQLWAEMEDQRAAEAEFAAARVNAGTPTVAGRVAARFMRWLKGQVGR